MNAVELPVPPPELPPVPEGFIYLGQDVCMTESPDKHLRDPVIYDELHFSLYSARIFNQRGDRVYDQWAPPSSGNIRGWHYAVKAGSTLSAMNGLDHQTASHQPTNHEF
jgi:hypothetical protein